MSQTACWGGGSGNESNLDIDRITRKSHIWRFVVGASQSGARGLTGSLGKQGGFDKDEICPESQRVEKHTRILHLLRRAQNYNAE